jgi:hypothetical protein
VAHLSRPRTAKNVVTPAAGKDEAKEKRKMEDINHWRGTGTVVEDAEKNQLPNGKVVASFLLRIEELATTRNGRKIPLTNVVKVIGWHSLAEHASTHAKAGARVHVHARIHVSDWRGRNGDKHPCFELHLTDKIKTIEEWVEELPSPAPLTPKLP